MLFQNNSFYNIKNILKYLLSDHTQRMIFFTIRFMKGSSNYIYLAVNITLEFTDVKANVAFRIKFSSRCGQGIFAS